MTQKIITEREMREEVSRRLKLMADRLRAERLSQNISVYRLAKMAGVRPATIHNIELGRRIRNDSVARVTIALGLIDSI